MLVIGTMLFKSIPYYSENVNLSIIFSGFSASDSKYLLLPPALKNFSPFSGTSMQHPCNPKPLEKSYNGNTLRG